MEVCGNGDRQVIIYIWLDVRQWQVIISELKFVDIAIGWLSFAALARVQFMTMVIDSLSKY